GGVIGEAQLITMLVVIVHGELEAVGAVIRDEQAVQALEPALVTLLVAAALDTDHDQLRRAPFGHDGVGWLAPYGRREFGGAPIPVAAAIAIVVAVAIPIPMAVAGGSLAVAVGRAGPRAGLGSRGVNWCGAVAAAIAAAIAVAIAVARTNG